MARITALVIKDKLGNWSALGVGENEVVDQLVKQYNEITALGGVIKKGKGEIKLSEMRLLANNTGGGELKAGRRFVD
jgi:hypothetical protein